MALFHFTVTQTKRSKGQSAIASAAYRSAKSCTASITANTATTPESVVLSALTFSCRPMHRKNTQTVRPYGTQLKKPSVVRTPSLHTVLKFPCRMNFLLKKTSLWQGNFCFGSLSAGA